ncbi:hypothetical protein QBC44DRAFT_243216 [Cladorrhinum sp. PSN332]|nr:hypothetical protein QBC44DRAFT_243216 [Cladorrhinum sp. PSN332]
MLKSVEKIPRLHNILVLFFAWILLAGFVIMPGSFTSVKRAVDEASGIPINLGANRKLILSKANTATMVVGFVLTVAGTFGTAWLALRWRRNYVWLLNRIYMPLVLNSSIGFVSTIIGVYAMQFGEWSTQAIIAALIEVSVFVVGGLLFLVYNYWLLMKVSEDQRDAAGVSQEVEEEEEEDEFGTMWGKDENSKKKKKKKKKLWGGRGRKKGGGGGGWFRRLGEAGRKRPIAAGSVV